MHIVHIIARLNDGGACQVVSALCRSSRERGHRITILAGRSGDDERDLTEDFRARGLTIHTVPGLGRAVRPWDDLRALAELIRQLRILKPAIVHTHTAKAGALGRIACKMLRLACLHSYHGHVLHGYFRPVLSALAIACERLLADGHHHHALSPGQRSELRDHYHIGMRRRWHCLPPPVPRPPATAPPAWRDRLVPDRAVILLLARLVPVKDGALFLRMLACLDRLQPVQGLVCGDGPERAALEAVAAASGPPVLFTGFTPADGALAAADLLVLTSRNEGVPLSVVEAGQAGVAVVTTAVGGLRDLARLGVVTAMERDPALLAQACHELLRPDGPAVTQRARARSWARGLEPERLIFRYEALYTRICQGRWRKR